jgi:hypothetical protein
MRWSYRLEVAVLVLGTVMGTLGCGEGGDVTLGGGSCPTCSGAPSVTTACASEKTTTLASGPKGGGSGGSGGGATTTTTTTGTTFSAPPVVNVNTPPSSSVSIVCGSSTAPAP